MKPVHTLGFTRLGTYFVFLLAAAVPLKAQSAARSEVRARAEREINRKVQRLAGPLGIEQQVTISIGNGNSRLVSVEQVAREPVLFRISFEEEFLYMLDAGDLSAAIAHELGHIWIFTHFPYLQTESLANQHALKVVSREDLDGVYEKVRRWKRGNPAGPGAKPGSSTPAALEGNTHR